MSSFQLAEITRHPWVTAGGRGELEQELPMMEVVQTRVLPSAEAIDPDVLQVSLRERTINIKSQRSIGLQYH